jgi:hypothetical protein
MGISEALALLFLFNAAAEAGKYVGPRFIQGIERLVDTLGRRAATMFRAGELPREGDQLNALKGLEQVVENNLHLFSSLDQAILKRRVTRCLPRAFTPEQMLNPLKTDALIVGHVGGTSGDDPATIANRLYDQAIRENKVHWLVDAMMRFPGVELASRNCLLAPDD